MKQQVDIVLKLSLWLDASLNERQCPCASRSSRRCR
jgi:hypothetical protein